jgi:hypothetical protein
MIYVNALRFGLYILAVYVMLRWFEHKQIYYSSRRMDAAPSQLGLPFEDVFIPVENGERINAWYFPVQSASRGCSRIRRKQQ